MVITVEKMKTEYIPHTPCCSWNILTYYWTKYNRSPDENYSIYETETGCYIKYNKYIML